jgi:hypothetical protein
MTVLGPEGDAAKQASKILRDLGFLEQVGASHKVPMLYRDGLDLTQGKAFAIDDDRDEVGDEEE